MITKYLCLLPGPGKGEGGKYPVIPPGFEGPVPAGYFIEATHLLKNILYEKKEHFGKIC
jgi:hypothetical protein